MLGAEERYPTLCEAESLPGVEFVVIGLLVREVVVVGIVAVDRQLVLERRPPFRFYEAWPRRSLLIA